MIIHGVKSTSFLYAPMGTGKSTFFVIALAYVTKAQIDVVAPNI
jgi:reverse gyrase